MAAKASTGTEIPRVLIVVVLGLIVIVVIFAVLPFLQQIFSPQAKATISNAHESTAGCTPSSLTQYLTYTWTFTLTNTGNTDETVTVAVVLTGATIGTSPLYAQQYSLPKAMSKIETLIYRATDKSCYTNLTSVVGIQVTQTTPT